MNRQIINLESFDLSVFSTDKERELARKLIVEIIKNEPWENRDNCVISIQENSIIDLNSPTQSAIRSEVLHHNQEVMDNSPYGGRVLRGYAA